MEGSDIIRRFDVMQADRAIWEAHWREVAQVVLPRSDWFRGSARVSGDKHTEKLFDSTAPLALERFSAAIESMVTPRTQRWHGLRPRNTEIAEVQEVKVWCDQAVEIMFKARYSPRANFASQANDVYTSLGAFGTGGVFVDELPGQGIRYRSVHLSELCIAEDHQGVVDTVMRKMIMTARQAVQRFGADVLSDKINQDAEKTPEAQHEFIHAVFPNAEQKSDRRDYKGMAVASCYVEAQTKQIVSRGGYRRFPYAVSRYMTGPKEIYGRSPAMTVLAEIKMANEMSKTIIRAGQMTVNPPILLQEDGALTAFNHRAGALNFGGLDDQGRPMAVPFNTGARVDIGEDMVERRRRAINDAFLVTLFQILVESPAMTATEAMLRAQEKGALLAPTMGRIQSEFLGPLIERELDILYHAGMLPPMPDVLVENGGLLDVEYVSPLNRAQRAEEGVAIMRTLESMTPLAQVDPTVMDLFIPEDIGRQLAEINGMPSKLLRTKEQMDALKGQRAQAAQAQQLMAAAPVVSESMRNMAQAQALAASAPNQQAANIFAGGGQ
jgi:hypothetical protein